MSQHKVARLSIFLSMALIMGYIESILPLNFGIPGAKLGLTNVIILLVLYLEDESSAFIVSMLRILINGILFGNLLGMLFSFCGGILSFIVMVLIKRLNIFDLLTVSVCGGLAHNIGQIIAASFVIESFSIYYYLPLLLIAGFFTGLIIGIIVKIFINRIHYKK